MTINKTVEGGKLIIAPEGRLDTMTSPQLDAELDNSLTGVSEPVFDFAGLDYISSAGLRVLLKAQKAMNRQGSMVIRNVSDEIRDIFDVTGFLDIMTIE